MKNNDFLKTTKLKQNNVLGNGKFELSDIGAVGRNVVGGLAGGVLQTTESILDPLASAYYQATGNKNKALKVLNNSWSEKATDSMIGDDRGGAVMQTITGAAEGIGGVLGRTAIAVGLAALTVGTGGTAGVGLMSTGAYAAAQAGVSGLSFYGSGIQKAVQTTGELGIKERAYAAGSALIEFATESLFDSVGILGSNRFKIADMDGIMSRILGDYTNTVGGKIASSFMGEAVEESLAEIANLPLERLTINENATLSMKDVLSAGLQGGLVGAVLGGGQEVFNTGRYRAQGEKIIENNRQSEVLEEGKKLNNSYASYLQNRLDAGAEVSPTQWGKLEIENTKQQFENEVESIQKNKNLSRKQAEKAFYEERAVEVIYNTYGAKAFMGENNVKESSVAAVDEYVKNGGNKTELWQAAHYLSNVSDNYSFEYNPNGNDGMYTKEGEIVINLASDKFIGSVITHETVHSLGNDFVNRMYSAIHNTQWAKANEQGVRDSYANAYGIYDDVQKEELLKGEVVARYLEKNITDTAKLVKELNGTNTLNDVILAYFKGVNQYQRNLSKEDKATLKQAYKEFKSSIESNKNNASSTAQKDGQSSHIRFSLKSFSEQVDAVISGADTTSTHLKIAETSQILQDVGLSDLPVLMTANHLKNMVHPVENGKSNYHGLSTNIIKGLPQMLESPTMILESLTRDDSIVVVGDVVDNDGNPVIAAIRLEGTGNYQNARIIANILTSAYGKQNFNSFIERTLKENKVLYYDKKKSHALSLLPGVQFPSGLTALDPNTIIRKFSKKSTTFNEKSSNQIEKYSLKETNDKSVAEKSHKMQIKGYSKTAVRSFLNELDEELLQKQYGLQLNSKTKEIEFIYNRINEMDEESKEEAIDAITDHLIKQTVCEKLNVNDVFYEELAIIEYVRENLKKKYSFSKALKKEIKARYDTSAPGIISSWSTKNAPEFSKSLVDYESLYRTIGIDPSETFNDFDAFEKLYDTYHNIMERIEREAKSSATASMTKEELSFIKDDLRKTVAKLIERRDASGYNIASKAAQNLLKDTAPKMNVAMRVHGLVNDAKEYKKRKYSTSYMTSKEGQELNAAISKIMTKNGGLLRDNLGGFLELVDKIYNRKVDGEYALGECYDNYVAESIDYLKTIKRDDPFELKEYQELESVLKGCRAIFRKLDTVKIEGRREDTKRVATAAVKEIRSVGYINNSKSRQWFLQNTCDPMTYLRHLSGYNEDSTLIRLFRGVQEGEYGKERTYTELKEPFDAFFKNNKGYEKKLTSTVFEIKAYNVKTHREEIAKIPRSVALQLYLTAKREHAQKGLKEAGFTYEIEKGDKKLGTIKGYYEYKIDLERINDFDKELFDSQDKEYIKLAQKFFEKSTELKSATDLEVYGYTKVVENDYIPIRRDSSAFKTPFEYHAYMKEFQTVNSLSMNKDTVEGAAQALSMAGLENVIERHADQTAMYAHLHQPINAFTRVWDRTFIVNEETEETSSLKLEVKRLTGDGSADAYLQKVIKAIQGNSRTKSKFVSKVKSRYVKYNLAFNIKTICVQVSSYTMAMLYCKPKNLFKAIVPKLTTEQVHEACPFIKMRSTEKQIVKAKGADENISSVGEWLMKGITWMDDAVMCRIFETACYDVLKPGEELFSPSNLSAAAERAERVIRETQANSYVSEKSGMMISESDLVQASTMFQSDAMKQCSRVVDAIGKLEYARKTGNDKMIKEATAQLKRTSCGVLTNMAIATAITLIFKASRGQLEEEEAVKAIVEEFGGNMFGMVPIARDFYTYFVDGYETSTFTSDVLNEVFGGITSVYRMLYNRINKQEVSLAEVKRTFKKVSHAFGMVCGVPTRNVENFVKNTFGRIVEIAANKEEALLEEANKYKNKFIQKTFSGNKFASKSFAAKDFGAIKL